MSKPLKICHFASVHTIDDTRVFNRECVSLAKHFDTTLIGIGNFSGVKNDVKVIGINKPKSHLLRIFTTGPKAFIKALKVNAQLYHFHDAELIPYALLLKLIGKKVIFDIHENIYGDILYKPWIPKALRSTFANCYKLFEKIASHFFHHILVIAGDEYANRFSAKKYTIIKNYADNDSFKSYRVDRASLSGNHLFYAGTIYDSYYDFTSVAEAILLLKNKIPDIHLHCLGNDNGYIKNILEKKSWYAEVKNHITFYGQKSMNEAYEISKKCKVGLCLKNQPESILVSHERKLFEYMAIGIPVVTCNADMYKSLVEKNGLGLCANLSNPAEIAEVITQILNNKSLITHMQHACETATEKHYNWHSQESILIDMYQRVLSIKK